MFSFRPPHAEGGGGVPEAEVFPWYEHVAVWEEGVGKFYLLRDHYCIPHVLVYKVDPEAYMLITG